jgi:hypothetical protein
MVVLGGGKFLMSEVPPYHNGESCHVGLDMALPMNKNYDSIKVTFLEI